VPGSLVIALALAAAPDGSPVEYGTWGPSLPTNGLFGVLELAPADNGGVGTIIGYLNNVQSGKPITWGPATSMCS
jgi:hypothetical protein